MRGGPRRNKPEPLRTLHGSRTRPRHQPSIAVTPVDALDPPPGLSAMELEFWTYYASRLASIRVLTEVDREALANHCIGLAQVREIRRQQRSRRYRRLVMGRSNPLDAQLRAWLQLTRLSAAELGLSPVSRARIAPAGAKEAHDELDTFIKAPIRRVK